MPLDPEPNDRRSQVQRALLVAIWSMLTIAAVWILSAGRDFLVPLVMAIFAAFLMETVTRLWMKIRIGGRSMPRRFAVMLSTLSVVLVLYLVGNIVATNASKVARDAPTYEANLNSVYAKVVERADKLGFEESSVIDDWVAGVDFGAVITSFASAMAELVGDFALVLIYLFFLLLERKFFDLKLRALFPDPSRRQHASTLLQAMDHDVRIYIGVKTFVSLLTAGGGYVVMSLAGLNYAEFWALLLFVFNFIPNVGSLVATLLPALLALLQFEDNPFRHFLIVGGGIWAVQLIVSNLVEPPLMGKSLNMSALVVILSLVFWGMLWGVAGMFLCIPLTVSIMIACSYFPSTRWIALLLSQDGNFRSPRDRTVLP